MHKLATAKAHGLQLTFEPTLNSARELSAEKRGGAGLYSLLGRAGYKNVFAARDLRKSKQNMDPASEQTYRLADTTFRVRGPVIFS